MDRVARRSGQAPQRGVPACRYPARAPRTVNVRLSLGNKRIASHADLTPLNYLMASVRRIPALSTVASAYVRWVTACTPWQSPRIANPRAECRVPPVKEDGC
jgi:hypothetical protein